MLAVGFNNGFLALHLHFGRHDFETFISFASMSFWCVSFTLITIASLLFLLLADLVLFLLLVVLVVVGGGSVLLLHFIREYDLVASL